MFLYKDNRFHFSNISFCLPDNVYLNTTCEEYEDCIELHPVDADFRIIIFGDYSEGGAKQFFAKGEETCYRHIGETETIVPGNITGYTISYNSTHNAYREYRFDIDGEESNVLGILVHGDMPIDMDVTSQHQAVKMLLQSLKTE